MIDTSEILVRETGALRETVVDILRQVLQRQDVGADDDFFDLGGDSLIAIQLFTELERVTGRKLPITAIYDAPTASALAALLDEAADSRPAFSPLVLMNEGPVTPPVFIVHGIGGNVMELAQLCRVIEPTRRVFAIQARGLDGLEPAITSIEEMADYYLAAVRREQPEGPYLLVGYSFGGMVVLEMARRIEAAGQKLAFLGFIDAYPHPDHWPRLSWLDVRWRRAARGASTRIKRVREALGWPAGGAAKRRGPNAIVRPFMFDEDWPEPVKRVYDTSLGALARYVPTAYPGSVVFFRAQIRSFYLPNNPRRMWGRLLGHLEVVTAPGDHVEMVGSKSAVLGGEIGRRIRDGLARLSDHPAA